MAGPPTPAPRPRRPVVAAVPSLHRVGTSLPRSRESQSQPPGIGAPERQESASEAALPQSNSGPDVAIRPPSHVRPNNEEGLSHVLWLRLQTKALSPTWPEALGGGGCTRPADPCDSTPPCTGLWLTSPQGGNQPPSSLLHIHVSLTVSWDLQDATAVRGEAPRTFRAAVAACRAVSSYDVGNERAERAESEAPKRQRKAATSPTAATRATQASDDPTANSRSPQTTFVVTRDDKNLFSLSANEENVVAQ